jgi:transposase
MNRDYGFMVQQLRMLKVAYRNTLDVVYPHFDQLYEDVYSDIAMAIIETNSHPDDILKKRVETLSKQLEKNTKHHHNYCIKEAQRIKAYALNVQSGVSLNDYEVSELAHYHEAIKAQMIEVEIHLEHMIKLAKDVPLFKQLITIPGTGENLAARLIAEIGDILRFSNKRQLVAYAGIDPRVYQSGQVSGEHLHITKKGNKQLRTLLYLAVSSSLRSKKPSVIRDFYNKKRQQTNPLSHKAALIACANKLLRIIYGMSRNGTTFLI